MKSSTFTIRTGPFPMQRVSGYFLTIPCFIEIPVFNANSIDPDQMPDMGLHFFANVLCMRR